MSYQLAEIGIQKKTGSEQPAARADLLMFSAQRQPR
jgi:hypothetical protein